METSGIIAIIIATIVGLLITGFGIYWLIQAIKNHSVTFKSIALPLFGLAVLGFIVFILVKTL